MFSDETAGEAAGEAQDDLGVFAGLGEAERQQMVEQSNISLDGAVVVETSDGEVMDVEKRIAFLSPILQIGCASFKSSCPRAARFSAAAARRPLCSAPAVAAPTDPARRWPVCRFDPEFPDTPIHLHKVSCDAMERVIEYCSFHLAPGHSVKERKNFNKQFMRMDTARLCELASASHYLDLKSLIDLTCRALAKHIQGKNPEEIRETFNLPDDLTEEEKVAPIEFGMEDSRVRMLNSLYARKRKELAEAKRRENTPASLEDQARDDSRDVDDLLSFIEGPKGKGGSGGKAKAAESPSGADGGGGAGTGSERKKKKKERERAKKRERAEQQAKLEAENLAAEKAQLEAERAVAARRKAQKANAIGQSAKSGGAKGGSKKKGDKSSGSSKPAPAEPAVVAAATPSDDAKAVVEIDLDSDDISDEEDIDPDLRAAQDREVEEFARRLNGSLDASSSMTGGADLFAAFVTNTAAHTVAQSQLPATGSPPQPEPEPEEHYESAHAVAERLSVESQRIEQLLAEAKRLELAAQTRTAGAAAAAPAAVAVAAPPPHDFQQKLAGSAVFAGGGGAGAVQRWAPLRRVATAVWAPPPLFEACEPIPGVTRGSCAVSYCVATLTMQGVRATDVVQASFTGIGRAHCQLSAHVSEDHVVTVILRGIDDSRGLSSNVDGDGDRIQPSAGQVTVVAVDYLAGSGVEEEKEEEEAEEEVLSDDKDDPEPEQAEEEEGETVPGHAEGESADGDGDSGGSAS